MTSHFEIDIMNKFLHKKHVIKNIPTFNKVHLINGNNIRKNDRELVS